MHPSISPLLEIYKTNTQLFLHAFGDVSTEDAVKQPFDTSNSMHFIAGHMTGSRFLISRMAGLPDEYKWSGLFQRGAQLKDQSEYPSLAEIIDAWKYVSEKMLDKLSGLSSEDLAIGAPFDFPVEDKTLLGGIAFMALHESYHIGQLAYIRKLLGYKSLVG